MLQVQRGRVHQVRGTGYRKVKRGAECGERSGRPSKGGKALIALKGRRDFNGPFYCMGCHPQMNGQGVAVLETLALLEDREF